MTDRELNQEIVVPRRRGSGGRGREHTSLYTLYRREGEGECDVMEVERNTRDGEGESNDQGDYNSSD